MYGFGYKLAPLIQTASPHPSKTSLRHPQARGPMLGIGRFRQGTRKHRGAPRLRRAVLACAAIAVGGCGNTKVAPSAEHIALVRDGNRVTVPENSPLRDRLKVDVVKEQEIDATSPRPPSSRPSRRRWRRSTPPLAGKWCACCVKFGDVVRAGQPLLTLDSPDLAQAQSDYLRAKSSLAQAERTLARQQDLDGARHRRAGARSSRRRPIATSRESELERCRVALEAAQSGHQPHRRAAERALAHRRAVIDLAVTPGEFTNDPNAVLMTVADLSTVWVTANVQEKDIRRVHKGDDATAPFAAYPGETLRRARCSSSAICSIPTPARSRSASPSTTTDGRLKPGMFATVTFAETATADVVVPTPALVLVGDETFVFVEAAPWTFERARVDPASSRASVTVVTDGLTAGDAGRRRATPCCSND